MSNLFHRRNGIPVCVFLLINLGITACSKEKTETPPPPDPQPAVLTTTTISAVTKISASTGGSISSDGGAPVTARGVCWSTSANPTIAGSKTSDGTGTGSFSSELLNLTQNTTYYVRAYATNSVGTAYGQEISFTTSDLILEDGLLSFWDFDDTDEEEVDDEWGSWDLQLINSPKFHTPGLRGGCMDFNTNSISYLEYKNISSGNKNTYTLAAWIYLEKEVDDLKYIIGMNSGLQAEGAGAAEIKLYLTADNKLEAMYHTKNGALHNTEDVMYRKSGGTISLQKWYYVAAVIDAGNIELYINGTEDKANAVQFPGLKTALNITNGRVTVGNARLHNLTYVATRWFRGKIDEAGIWDRPLRAEEINRLYDDGKGLNFPTK